MSHLDKQQFEQELDKALADIRLTLLEHWEKEHA